MIAALALVYALACACNAGAASIDRIGGSSFVPNWNGDTDSAAISVLSPDAGILQVQVVNRHGHPVRILDAMRVAPGVVQRVYWDGRNGKGQVVRPGRYRFLATVTVDHATRSVTAPRITRRALEITVAASPLTVSVRRASRGVLSRRVQMGRSVVTLDMNRRGYLSAVVVDASGHVVRTLVAGDRRRGRTSVAWNGIDSTGVHVTDGRYVLMLSATAGGRPTQTQQIPLRVDTTAPSVHSIGATTVRARIRNGHVYVPIRVSTSEAARMLVTGRTGAGYRQRVPAGATKLLIRGSLLGIRPGESVRIHTVRVRMIDAGGNSRTISVRVRVRPRAQDTPSTPAPPVVGGDGGGGWIWPTVGCLSSHFGPRGNSFHYGADVAAPTGTVVVAAATGTVSWAGEMGGYGNLVIVEHPGGITTRYGHLSRIDVTVGEALARGQQLGLVGSTGHSTGPHLHFEVRRDESAIDPLQFMPGPAPAAC